MLPTILLAIAAAAPSPSAEPTTYSCNFPSRGAADIRFTLDPGSSTVAMYEPKTGYREMMIGFFSGENVSFANNRLVSYAMNRASGSITSMVARSNRSENGTCVAV